MCVCVYLVWGKGSIDGLMLSLKEREREREGERRIHDHPYRNILLVSKSNADILNNHISYCQSLLSKEDPISCPTPVDGP